jgi:hypothetical protein
LKRILQKLNDPEKEELNIDLDEFAVLADLSVEVAKKMAKNTKSKGHDASGRR